MELEKLKCMVWTHSDKALCEEVLELARSAGFIPYFKPIPRQQDAYVFGKWNSNCDDTNLYNATWNKSLWEQHPDWPRFDAATDMEKIRAHFRGEPEFDEAPLPYEMDPEQAKEIRSRFNLSQEQWEMFPPVVKYALAGREVTVVRSEHKWHPMSEPKRNSDTVMVASHNKNPSAHECGVGYFSDREYISEHGTENPNYWAEIPHE